MIQAMQPMALVLVLAFVLALLVTQFVAFSLIAAVFEYVCSWVLEYGLHMKAWDYRRHFLNIEGRVSLKMTVLWGTLGVAFSYWLVPLIDQMFDRMQGILEGGMQLHEYIYGH